MRISGLSTRNGLGAAAFLLLAASLSAAPVASASGGGALKVHGGVSLSRSALRDMIQRPGDPCANAPVVTAPIPPANDPLQTPPVAAQWKACFPNQGGLTADVQIAAGPNRLIVTNQSQLGIYYKSGTYVGSVDIGTFFSPLGLDDDTPDAIDAFRDFRALYDEYRGRFWVVALGSRGAQRDPADRRVVVLAAVSKTSNPVDGWWLYWWDAVTGFGQRQHAVYDAGDVADDPFIGIDPFGLHQTNRVVNGLLNRYWRVAFVPGNALAQGTLADGWQYWDLVNPNGTKAWVVQPVVHHGTTTRAYYASRQGTDKLVVWALTQPLMPAQQITRTAVTVDPWHAPLDAAQRASVQQIRMSRMGSHVLKASYRDNRLHLVTNDAVAWDADDDPSTIERFWTSVRLVRLNVSGYPAVPGSGAGFIDYQIGKRSPNDDAEADRLFYGWPAVETTDNGDMAVVYNRSGRKAYPEMRWSVYRDDPTHTQARRSRLVKAGEAPYSIAGWNGTSLPWGETAGASVDPFDDTSAWIAHQYADAQPGSFGNYEIWVAKVLGQTLPEFQIFAIDIRTADVGDPGMPIDYLAIAFNGGEGPGEDVVGRLALVRADGLRIRVADVLFESLRPGERARVADRFVVPPGTPAGTYVLEATIDPENRFAEYDKTNNVLRSGQEIVIR